MKAEEEVLVQTMNSQLGDRQKPGSCLVKDLSPGDRNTVKHLLDELKEDLESYKAKCFIMDIRRKLKNVIFDVCDGIKYFSKIEFLGRKQKKMDTLKYLAIIFICYGVFLIEK